VSSADRGSLIEVDKQVSRTLDDIERRLKQLEVELAAAAPPRPTEPAGEADRAAPTNAPPVGRSDQPSDGDRADAVISDGDRADAVIMWDEHAGGPVAASAAGRDNGAASRAPADELAGARERVVEISHELLRGYDELLHFRGRLEQAKGDLIEDYKRLLESRDPARPVNG
jgi:hypothetical protein